MSSIAVAAALFLLLLVDLVAAHVSLTFPPARQYALDFLDNTRYVAKITHYVYMKKGRALRHYLRPTMVTLTTTFRTPLPCGGMKKGSIKTTLPAGRKHKITWHLGYAHQGGVRIELYDGQDRKLQDLTQGFVNGGDITVRALETPSNTKL